MKNYNLSDYAEMARKSVFTEVKKNVKQITKRNENEKEYNNYE